VSAPVNDKSVICDGLCAADCGCIDCRSCEGCGDCGRGPTDVSDLPEVIRSYPVIVEETRRYVLWLDGESPADAVAQFTDEPYAPEPGAMFRFDWTDPSAVGGEPKATSKDASDLGGDVA
jgi:hypothetical protein